MDMEITGQEENPLLGRETFEITVEHSGEATPSSAKLLKKFGAENDFELDHLTIGSVNTQYGGGRSTTTITAHNEKVENVLAGQDEEEPAEEPDEAEAEEENEEAAADEADNETEEDDEEDEE